jgi:hypothetical protein
MSRFFVKFLSIAFFLCILLSGFSGCKKCKRGVLEVHATEALGGELYWVEFPDPELYEENKLLSRKPISQYNIKEEVFYWPNESARSLGYKERCGEDGDGSRYGVTCMYDEPGENGNWAGKTVTGKNGTGHCIEGTWYNSACGDSKGVIWKFDGKNGSSSNKDCNGICSAIIYTFSYTISGNNCKITYDDLQPIVSCTGYVDSRPPKPNDDNFTFTCSGSSLTVTSSIGTTTFIK